MDVVFLLWYFCINFLYGSDRIAIFFPEFLNYDGFECTPMAQKWTAMRSLNKKLNDMIPAMPMDSSYDYNQFQKNILKPFLTRYAFKLNTNRYEKIKGSLKRGCRTLLALTLFYVLGFLLHYFQYFLLSYTLLSMLTVGVLYVVYVMYIKNHMFPCQARLYLRLCLSIDVDNVACDDRVRLIKKNLHLNQAPLLDNVVSILRCGYQVLECARQEKAKLIVLPFQIGPFFTKGYLPISDFLFVHQSLSYHYYGKGNNDDNVIYVEDYHKVISNINEKHCNYKGIICLLRLNHVDEYQDQLLQWVVTNHELKKPIIIAPLLVNGLSMKDYTHIEQTLTDTIHLYQGHVDERLLLDGLQPCSN